ncbi:MAG: SOS response-associated peptidase [Lachnospiraceae bacterium]|nr:SOS response-associated peptidase [Lachnospiraceae bacterium]
MIEQSLCDQVKGAPCMCSRYYIDNNIPDEISALFAGRKNPGLTWTARDIHPDEKAPIIVRGKTGLSLYEMRWGFPQYSGKGLFINARAETALQKKTFSESVLYRRCVIPARHFYELPKYPAESAGGRFCRRDASKNKVTFLKENSSVLYLAGFYNLIQDELRFVVLTTQANPSVSPVHDRMPLILEADEVESWICDGSRTQAFLQKVPLDLQKTQEYEQQSLFGMLS